ncbi:MAG: dimethylarginine dimethylaminohydrolase family protein [Planctomycetota bacterium]
MARVREVFLCRPTHVELKYSINPWMDTAAPFSRELAVAQWEALVAAYKDVFGRRWVHLCEPQPELTELCFFGDSVFLCEQRALFGAFRHPERAAEQPYVQRYLEGRGFKARSVPKGVVFEGAGETVMWRDKILFGFGKRSDEVVRHFLRQTFKHDTIDLELEQEAFYHLDTAFLPLSDDLIAYYPGAFGPIDNATIESFDCEKLVVSEEDAHRFACNAVVHDQVVFGSAGVSLWPELRRRGYEVLEFDVSEFLKLGGGIKCLTLQHYQT